MSKEHTCWATKELVKIKKAKDKEIKYAAAVLLLLLRAGFSVELKPKGRQK
jgi:hypothetical protein